MMDMSSIIDASLALGGAIAVLIGISMLPSESSTVSTSYDETGHQSDGTDYPPLEATV